MKILGLSIAFSFIAVAFYSGVAHGQVETDLPEELGTALGIFKLNSQTTKIAGFETFDFFQLKKFRGQNTTDPIINRDGTVSIDGQIQTKDGRTYKFRQGSIKRLPTGEYEEINFITQAVKGIRFEFKGRFLRTKILEKNGSGFSTIRGMFIKKINGKRMATGEFSFFEFATL